MRPIKADFINEPSHADTSSVLSDVADAKILILLPVKKCFKISPLILFPGNPFRNMTGIDIFIYVYQINSNRISEWLSFLSGGCFHR